MLRVVTMSHDYSAYDPSIHEELKKINWDAVLPSVLKYAVWRTKKFGWLGEKVDPEALVQEAIARVYGIGTNGTYRNWDREACPDIAVLLIGIIRSMTSHMAEHEAGFPKESLFLEDGSPKDSKLFVSADETAGVIKPKTPEDELIEAENLQSLMSVLDSLGAEDEDLGMVILCIEDGISRPRFIARETGFEIDKVNNLMKKLRRKFKRFNPKIREQSSKERREEWA